MKRNDWIFLVVVVAVCAVLGGVFLSWIHGFGSPGTAATASRPGSSSGSGSSGPAETSHLVIPSIGANAPIVSEGASGPDGGALDVPSSVHVIGWWDGVWQSPTGTVKEKVAKPGDPGVALLAGHIDSAIQGRGALYRLQAVKPGASVTVWDAHGAATRWKVTRVQVVQKSDLPRGLFANSGPSRLAVVSCGGPFDAATGHYVDNIIAWTVPA